MAEEKDKYNTDYDPQPEEKEKEIDLLEIIYKLWSRKKLILVWCMWGVIVGLVIAFSIPKEYSTEVTLAPEASEGGPTGGLGALASMAGLGSMGNYGSDAVYPLLYPDIVSSVPFATSLFDVPVTDKEGNVYTVKDYLKDETKSPWWGYVMKLPGKLIALMKPDDEEVDKDHVTDNFKLTKQEVALVKALNTRVTADVDQKTDVITIKTMMQDPMISAVLADTVVSRLRQYITDYRTNKARKDLEYVELLNDEAQQEYFDAQQKLADYIDRNQNLATRSAQVTRDRLQNEATLAFNLYNETALQVKAAKSRVQETTPVYTEITPATVPLKASSPRKLLIIFAFTFLAFAGCCGWILFGCPMVAEYKKKAEELKKSSDESKIDSENNTFSEPDIDSYEIDHRH